MKIFPFSSLRPLGTAALLTAFSTLSLHAADGTWTFAGDGNWGTSSNWSGGTIASGSGATATFQYGTPNTTNSVISVEADRTIGNLNFLGTAGSGTHNFTINGPGILTLAGTTPTISSTLASRDAKVNVVLAGSSGLTLANNGSTVLSIGGANTYTGLTTISTGIITVANNLAFGSTTGATTVSGASGGAAVRLNDGITVTGETLNVSGNGTGSNYGTLHTALNATAEWAGNIVLTNSSRFGANGATSSLILNGVISDGAPGTGVAFSYGGNSDANGTVILKGANTYSGSTSVFRGTLKLDAGNNRLPTGTTLTIGGTALDATVNLNGYDQTVATLRSSSGAGVRTLTNAGADNSVFTVNQVSGTETYDGLITGDITFVKSGAGTLNLTGTANTFTGDITVNGGTLGIASAFINNTADVSIASGAVFALNFDATDTIAGLYLNGIAQALGTYGSLASDATFKSAFFTGDGILNVTEFSAVPEPSTTAAIMGASILGLCLLRRHRSTRTSL